MKGYKMFDPNWTCRGFKYEVGKTYEMKEAPVLCKRGFHFCKDLADFFKFYSFQPENKVAEVESSGDIDTDNCHEFCTNKITIVRELTWDEVLRTVNTGKACTGFGNSGDFNTGERNSGSFNTGDNNTGNSNTGDENSGFKNSGNRNAGDRNTGWQNLGDRNTGSMNDGDYNTGEYNLGRRNTGQQNSGSRNTGSYNEGLANTGDYNSGNFNSGNHNTGSYNTGDWNTASSVSGCFCTEEPRISLFNKPSRWTIEDWLDSEAKEIMDTLPSAPVTWVSVIDMDEKEKLEHPEYKTTGGYLMHPDEPKNAQKWWDRLGVRRQNVIRAIPNFDPEVFRQCTGIDTEKTPQSRDIPLQAASQSGSL